MFLDPFGILTACSVITAIGKAAAPLAERFEEAERYGAAEKVLRAKGLTTLAVREATLADNDEHMQRHARRMADGGFNLADPTDMADFVEDMRVQLKVGEYVEGVFREHGSECRHCGHVITSMKRGKN